MVSIKNNMKEFYLIAAVVSILLFLLAGYAYPATEEDIAKNKVFPFYNDGTYDRGRFTQFFASLAFTGALFLLGYYVNTTFVKFGMKSWGLFAFGVFLMFLYGLGKIGELTYNHGLFDTFKDLLLPVALIVLAIASYRISMDFEGGR